VTSGERRNWLDAALMGIIASKIGSSTLWFRKSTFRSRRFVKGMAKRKKKEGGF